MDEDEIRVGESIPAAVERGLMNTRFLVLCLSTAALSSGWVEAELHGTLMTQFRDRSACVLPVRLEPVQPPRVIAHLAYTDLFPGEAAFYAGVRRLLDAIAHFEQSPAPPMRQSLSPGARRLLFALAILLGTVGTSATAVILLGSGEDEPGRLASVGYARGKIGLTVSASSLKEDHRYLLIVRGEDSASHRPGVCSNGPDPRIRLACQSTERPRRRRTRPDPGGDRRCFRADGPELGWACAQLGGQCPDLRRDRPELRRHRPGPCDAIDRSCGAIDRPCDAIDRTCSAIDRTTAGVQIFQEERASLRCVCLHPPLMKRSFGFDVLRCPRCATKMRVLGTLTQPDTIRRILVCLGQRAEPLVRAPARDPTWEQLDFDAA
jgi:hypothetical protein